MSAKPVDPVPILKAAAQSPIAAAFAAAVAEVHRTSQRVEGPMNFGGSYFNAGAIKQLFAPLENLSDLQNDFETFLAWVAESCGKAADKTVLKHAYIGEINQYSPPQVQPFISIYDNEGMKKDAFLFINYTSNGNDTSASFALAKPRMSLSPDGRPSVYWTVFSKNKPDDGYVTYLQNLVGDMGVEVVWIPAIYDSLAALVNDILAHLVYEGRPPSYALWSGGEIPRALVMAGLHDLGLDKIFATIRLLNVCGHGTGQRKPSIITNPSAPPALPQSKSKFEFENMYPATSQPGVEPALKRRTKNTVWATNVEKALKTWKSFGKTRYSNKSQNLLEMINSSDEKAYSFLYTYLNGTGWTAAAALQDISYALLSMVLNVDTLGKGDEMNKNTTIKGLFTAFQESFSRLGTALPDRDGLMNTVTSALFYGMFFELLSKNNNPGETPYERLFASDDGKSEFMYTAMMHGLDQFIDLQGYETALGYALIGKKSPMGDVQIGNNDVFDILSTAHDFILTNKDKIGLRDGSQFQSIGSTFSNVNASLTAKDQLLHNVFRIVAFSAMLMALSSQAGNQGDPLVTMSWPTGGELDPVPRMGHFWVRNKIAGGRRGSTTAAAALDALRAFGKTIKPTDNDVVNSLPLSVRTAVPKKQTPQQQQQQQPSYQPQQNPGPGKAPANPSQQRGGQTNQELANLLANAGGGISDLQAAVEAFKEVLALSSNDEWTIKNAVVDAADSWTDAAKEADSKAASIQEIILQVRNALSSRQ